MKRREPVSHIMTKHVISVDVKDSLKEVETLMKKNHIRHIPVASGDALVGMLSLSDLLRVSFVDDYGDEESHVDTAVYEMLSVPQVMVTKPRRITSDTSIRDVALILAEEEYHALPVVDNEKLVGIVTSTDLIKYLLEQY